MYAAVCGMFRGFSDFSLGPIVTLGFAVLSVIPQEISLPNAIYSSSTLYEANNLSFYAGHIRHSSIEQRRLGLYIPRRGYGSYRALERSFRRIVGRIGYSGRRSRIFVDAFSAVGNAV